MLKKLVNFIPGMAGWIFKTSWKKKAVIIALILIAGAFAGYKIISGREDGYILGVVQRRTITEIVTESGTITTNGSVDIYSPTNGVVEEFFVSNGEAVSENQKLFTVKSTATPKEKAEALATYQVAEIAVKQAENTLRGNVAIVDRVHDDVKNHEKDENFLLRETRTTAEVASDNAYDAVKAARAKLVSAQVTYQSTQNATVTTPISGSVYNLSVASESSVLIYNPLVPKSPVLIIGGLGITEMMVSIGESDINKIKIGQKVDIKLDAVDNKIYKGVIKRFDRSGTITQGVVKFNVYIEITDPDDKLKPNMTADVDIVTNEIRDVLSVPNTAIKPYQKSRAVRKLGNNGKIEFIPVRIGVRGKEFTQITGGLEENQKIVVSLTNEKAGKKSLFGF